VIRTFRDGEAEELFRHRKASRRLAPYAKAALRKLDEIDVVDRVDELFKPPGNKLKKIGKDVWQLRIDGRHRIRFRWDGHDAYDVEVGDFH
jgi:proteic killer suppression protein